MGVPFSRLEAIISSALDYEQTYTKLDEVVRRIIGTLEPDKAVVAVVRAFNEIRPDLASAKVIGAEREYLTRNKRKIEANRDAVNRHRARAKAGQAGQSPTPPGSPAYTPPAVNHTPTGRRIQDDQVIPINPDDDDFNEPLGEAPAPALRAALPNIPESIRNAMTTLPRLQWEQMAKALGRCPDTGLPVVATLAEGQGEAGA